MIFTLGNIKNSIAGVLKKRYDYLVFSSPTQQGAEAPCFFIFFMPSHSKNLMSDRSLEDIGIDILLLQESNVVNANDELEEAAQYLCEEMDVFEYSDGNENAKIRTYEREWKIVDHELHYQFHIKARIRRDAKIPHMENIEEFTGGIKK